MLFPFLALAASSPSRQLAFRRAVVVHVLVISATVVALASRAAPHPSAFLGYVLVTLGIVEGAVLLGWRLTQIPKSQALEFMLVSPQRPGNVFLCEALVGCGRLALVTLAGLPILLLLIVFGFVDWLDLVPLLAMPFTWGAFAGLSLTVWSYEPQRVRRWAERLALAGVVVYLVVGLLAGEHLKSWLDKLPDTMAQSFLAAFEAFHLYNPFSVIGYWMEQEPQHAWQRALGMELAGLAAVCLLLARAALRLKAHFHEEHYQPAVDRSRRRRPPVGEQPLAWWAVKRVTKYSGRINFWLAGGAGLLYAAYTVAGDQWPAWLGKRIFEVFEQSGGIPVLATAMAVMAAVPAAFQYGLWDSSRQDRCRRLELLLLTDLSGRDYWNAAAAAAWRRGRGYFGVALILWVTAAVAGKANFGQASTALAASVLLWAIYFAIGFRAFARGSQANGLGMLLTLGLPLLVFACARAGWPGVAALLPPGSVHSLGTSEPTISRLAGPILAAAATLLLARHGLAYCDRELRRWYELHHGKKVID
jgi:hypothetical protein